MEYQVDIEKLLNSLTDVDVEFVDVGFDAEPMDIVKSKTAFDLDKWSIRMGERILESELINEEIRDQINPEEMADLHSAAYEIKPELVDFEHCECPERHRWVESLMGNPNWAAVRSKCLMNPVAAKLATEKLAGDWIEYRIMVEQRVPSESETMNSANNAANNASQTVEELEEMMNSGLGGGPGEGTAGRIDEKAILERYQKMQSSHLLRSVIRRAGAYRRLAQSLQKNKTVHGPSEMNDIKLGGEVSRMLSSQKAMIAYGGMAKKEMLRKLVERQAMVYQMTELEGKGKGPIVVFVDESGSMDGERIQNAKAIALAITWIAKQQNRHCYLVSFSGYSSLENSRIADIDPKNQDTDSLMEWVCGFDNGGTVPDVPFREVKKLPLFDTKIKYDGNCDMIVITDADMSIPTTMTKEFVDWRKEREVNCYGIVLGASDKTIKPLCTRSWSEKELGIGNESIAEVFSL